MYIYIYVYMYAYTSVYHPYVYIYVHVWVYMHRGLVVHICVSDLCHRWFGLRAFRMNGVKSLAKSTLTYCQLGISLKILH